MNIPKSMDVKRVRESLHFTRGEFANYFGVSVRTLQEWEQGRRIPAGPARALLAVIAREPLAVQRALKYYG